MSMQSTQKITLLLGLLKLLKLFYPKGNIHRFEEAIRSYLELVDNSASNSSQKLSDFLYPGITHKPWYESRENDALRFVTDTLEKGYSDIENEWLDYLSSNRNIVPKYKPSELFETPKDKDEDWNYYLIWRQGKFTEAGLSLFPKTVKIVSELESFLYPFGEVVFIVMKPGVVLPPHTDDINISLTCHLGITTPEGCGIKVGGETRSWSRGKNLYFDNSFEHEAWNKGKENRVVLLLDLYHTELTKVEKELLQFVLKRFNLTGEKGGFHAIQDSQYQQKLLANLSANEYDTVTTRQK